MELDRKHRALQYDLVQRFAWHLAKRLARYHAQQLGIATLIVEQQWSEMWNGLTEAG